MDPQSQVLFVKLKPERSYAEGCCIILVNAAAFWYAEKLMGDLCTLFIVA